MWGLAGRTRLLFSGPWNALPHECTDNSAIRAITHGETKEAAPSLRLFCSAESVLCWRVHFHCEKDRGAMCAGGHPQRAAPGACAVTVPAAATSSPPCPRPHAQIDQLPFSQKRLAHPTNAQAPVSYSCLPHPLLHTPGAYSYCRPVSQAPAPRHLPSRACQCESRNRVHANVQTLV